MTTKTIEGIAYQGFDSWEDVQAAVSRGARLFYQAPLDYRPARVMCVLKRANRVHVTPLAQFDAADPFMADRGHLSRFWIVAPKAEA